MGGLEEVLVISRKCLQGFDRFVQWSEASSIVTCARNNFEWLPRIEAENSKDWVQPIPCALIRNHTYEYCVFRRVRQSRLDLHARISLVVGGHVDKHPKCESFASYLISTLRRELQEELGIEDVTRARPIGLVIDSLSVSASRHIAFVCEIDFSGPLKVQAPEEFSSRSKFSGNFFAPSELRQFNTKFDPWSLVLFEDYIGSRYSKRTARQIKMPYVLDE